MHTLYTLEKNEIPFLLQQITDPPKKLFVKGKLPNKDTKMLCIVGARKHSSYGEEVCKKLIAGLKGHNICIVSGLAIGIDGIAHRAALENGLMTIAFPGSGLDPKVLYPYSNRKLASEILNADGAIISEFKMDQSATIWTFPQRNRLMAGISHAVIVIEAELQSGTLITSKLAVDYNRDVGAIPGSIFSKLSEGPNMLISLGAKTVRNSNDILEILELKSKEEKIIQPSLLLNLTNAERKVVEYLQIEPHTNEQLILKTELPAKEINEVLSNLEIQGLIEERFGKFKVV